MIGPRLLDVFSAPGLQIGPLYLLLLGLATKALTVLGSPVATRALLGGTQAAMVVWFAMWTTQRSAHLRGHEAVAGRWAVGLLLGLGGFAAEGIGNGHPEEILVALLLLNAALSAASDRHGIAGAVLAAAVGLKQWGAFGGGILLLHRGRTGLLRGAGTLAGLTLLLYGPFFLFGTVRTFDFSWGFGATSYLGSLGHAWGATDWQLRFIQGGLAGLVGVVAAWRRPTSPFLPVVCAISVRLLIDPLRLTYYSGALVVVVAVWAWSSGDVRMTRFRLLVTALTPLVVLGPYLLSRTVIWFAGTGLLVVVLVFAPRLDRPKRVDGTDGRQAVSR
ncbi:hypothetical protein CELL_02593 [Cellulomonas sp. T2.31MG-18]|uniref:hypothetical protein n=1 Tax=Cellulomonas sp. T2.31MG-18 TaxID=3157619 RepID=UPI0035EAAE77